MNKAYLIILIFFLGNQINLQAKSKRFRCLWRTDPATSMVIAWDQESGIDPIVYYDQADFGTSASAYRYSRRPDRVMIAKGMNNQFVRLEGLAPNTVYYFVIKDSEGTSKRYSFKTAPNTPDQRLSIIAGGDSRNNREARLKANRLVSKLRPHAVIFAGDMTDNDNDPEWREWFDDWQATIGSDGRVFPLIVARGNHEQNNKLMVDLFDVPNPKVYYSLTLGGNLFRVFTLNSNMAPGGEQRSWLENQLKNSQQITWRFAQYHHSIRPHTSRKDEQNEMVVNWSTLFYHYRVQLVLESDAHVVKCTYPIRPFGGPGNDEGFLRDDQNGTVYIGEGCWGSPLRDIDDGKSWTRQIGKFNQFKWIFIDQQKIEIRTVQTDISDQVAEISHQNIFSIPVGLSLWNPKNEDVITLYNHRPASPNLIAGSPAAIQKKMQIAQLKAQYRSDGIAIRWATHHETQQFQFEIQRYLTDRKEYLTLGKAPAKGKATNDYMFLDREYTLGPSNMVQYRIKCIHPDGSLSYKECQIKVEQKDASDWSKFPQIPIDNNGRVELKYRLQAENEVTIYVIDQQLQEVEKILLGQQTPGLYQQPINLSGLNRGQYLLILMNGKKPLGRYRMVKQ